MHALAASERIVPVLADRRARRVALSAPVSFIDLFLRGGRIRLLNLSSGGFSGEGAGDLARDDIVWIELPGLGLVRSQVRWRIENRFGAAFLADDLRLRFLNGLSR